MYRKERNEWEGLVDKSVSLQRQDDNVVDGDEGEQAGWHTSNLKQQR